MSQKIRTIIIWIVLLLIGLGLAVLLGTPRDQTSNIQTSEFVDLIVKNKVTKVWIEGDQFLAEKIGSQKSRVRTTSSKTSSLIISALRENHRVIFNETTPPNRGSWIGTILNIIFLILPVIIVIWIIRGMRSGLKGGGPFGSNSITKHKGVRVEETSGKKFKDVAGIDEAVTEVKDLVDYLKAPDKLKIVGARPPKGILLVGEPGTGKTLLARALAGEAGVPFYSVSSASFVEMFVGVGAARVRDLIDDARKSAPCIIFFDEFDSVARKRGGVAYRGGGAEEGESTLNELLHGMDGVETSEGVLFLAATNQPDVLDLAATRRGRFDRQIIIPKPDVVGREAILKIHLEANHIPIGGDINLKILASQTTGMVGADLENLVNEAAWVAHKRQQTIVDAACFSEAIDKVLMGPARRALIMTELEKRTIAVHEAGHAVAGWFCSECDPVMKITIIPRGQALGFTMSVAEVDHYVSTKGWYLGQIISLLGGRTAEELLLQVQTSGCASDLERATRIAQVMVTQLGMSQLRLRTFGSLSHGFLNPDMMQRDFGEDTARVVDNEIDRTLEEAHRAAQHLLTEHRTELLVLVKELITRETLEVVDLERILGPRPRAAEPLREL